MVNVAGVLPGRGRSTASMERERYASRVQRTGPGDWRKLVLLTELKTNILVASPLARRGFYSRK